MNKNIITKNTFLLLTLSTLLFTTSISAKPSDKNQRVIDYWTAERIAAAIPRNLVLDKNNGLGYLKRPDGALVPHGHNKVTEISKLRGNVTKVPQAKPGGGGNDSAPPVITPIEPADGATVGASQRFAVDIADSSGVRSASLTIILAFRSE